MAAFGEEAVDVGVPLEGASEGVEDTDKARDKIFGFVQRAEEVFDDIGDGFKQAV